MRTGRTLFGAWAQTDSDAAWDDAASDWDHWEAPAAKVHELEQQAWTAGFDAAEVEIRQAAAL